MASACQNAKGSRSSLPTSAAEGDPRSDEMSGGGGLLSVRHPHPLDGLVEFEEEGHKYTHNPSGRRVPKSQTAATGPYFDTFKPDETIEKYYKGWRTNPDSKYWALIHYKELAELADGADIKKAIQLLWKLNGERAAADGTKMHKQLEDYLNGLMPDPLTQPTPPMGVALYLGMMQWFYPEQELEPWRVEFSVCVEVEMFEFKDKRRKTAKYPAICGNIDAIFRSKRDGRFWILDWKRVDPKKKGLLGRMVMELGGGHGKRKARDPDMASGPFHRWEATAYNKYSAQLHGYRWQLIEGGYMEPEQIAGCFLVQMHEDMQKAHVIEAADMADEVDGVMRAEVKAAKKAYIEEQLAQDEGPVECDVTWSIKCD
ncbi:MAG: hypothetical protein ACKVI4_15715 [Actinomycetales bacterium]